MRKKRMQQRPQLQLQQHRLQLWLHRPLHQHLHLYQVAWVLQHLQFHLVVVAFAPQCPQDLRRHLVVEALAFHHLRRHPVVGALPVRHLQLCPVMESLAFRRLQLCLVMGALALHHLLVFWLHLAASTLALRHPQLQWAFSEFRRQRQRLQLLLAAGALVVHHLQLSLLMGALALLVSRCHLVAEIWAVLWHRCSHRCHLLSRWRELL